MDGMERDIKAIKKNSARIAWYMRGALTYEDVLNLSPDELKSVNEIIEENLETTKKTQMPFF
jgi:hypothetical protein